MKATLTLDHEFVLGQVDPRLFGGFAEHLGRHIYEGIYEPDHPTADEQGFRRDVIALVQQLQMPIMRYPGGNFVSGYHWEDGVGPVDQRPRRLDLAWKSTESNQFGTNEFMDWCRKVGTAPMLAVNLGTRGPAEAGHLVEYCNHPGGTAWSDLRHAHGYPTPHNVKLWCLGNEMDGPWQTGQKTPTEYGRVASEAAKIMKWIDPTIELVACGSSSRDMASFGQWELKVLDHTFEQIDYLSLHTYYNNSDGDTPSFLSRPEFMNDFIEETVALCDAVASTRKSKKRIHLSFDEWNVWFHSHDDRQKKGIKDWAVAPPLLEDIYTMEDALVVGGMLISLLNHADRVKIGCLAQVVNVIAPIMTAKGGPAWKQTIFYPFEHASNFGRGRVLRPVIDSPLYDCSARDGTPTLAASCVENEDGTLTVFAINRSLDQDMDLRLVLRAFPELHFQSHLVLRHDDLKATNTESAPENVTPTFGPHRSLLGEDLHVRLSAASWNVIRLSPSP